MRNHPSIVVIGDSANLRLWFDLSAWLDGAFHSLHSVQVVVISLQGAWEDSLLELLHVVLVWSIVSPCTRTYDRRRHHAVVAQACRPQRLPLISRNYSYSLDVWVDEGVRVNGALRCERLQCRLLAVFIVTAHEVLIDTLLSTLSVIATCLHCLIKFVIWPNQSTGTRSGLCCGHCYFLQSIACPLHGAQEIIIRRGYLH